MSSSVDDFDVIVIGAGPAGCVAALAHAKTGARTLLLEANPNGARRLAGEWLHPLGLSVLRSLGLDPTADSTFDSARGFAVFPDDRSAPVVLPYADRIQGWSGEHLGLVEKLREAAMSHSGISYLPGARATGIEEQQLTFNQPDGRGERRVTAGLIVAADGRSSCARAALQLPPRRVTVSRMAGLRLRTSELPFEGFGHVFLGGPGPMLCYRIREDEVRLCLDVPLGASSTPVTLWEAYAPSLPEMLRSSFKTALRDGNISWAVNQACSRTGYGRPGLILVGDAVGFQHPLTAVGMTLGMADAATSVSPGGFPTWRRMRERETRVAEMLAGALYEIFGSHSASAAAIRSEIFELWRRDAGERVRTMSYMSGDDHRLSAFSQAFIKVAAPALGRLAIRAVRSGNPKAAAPVAREMVGRIRWLATGGFRRGQPAGVSFASTQVPFTSRQEMQPISAVPAIERGAAALLAEQSDGRGQPSDTGKDDRDFGSWEGEVAWCPMLAAQYVMLSCIIGIEFSPDRRASLLRHFEQTQLSSGLWGLHEFSQPYLFVTALVYVASRLLDVDADDPMLARARQFIRQEDILSIPSWGKLWLALVGLYDWKGVPPLVPELWALPQELPFHPSKFYCHTRHIHLAMSILYGRKVEAPQSVLLMEIRGELYPTTYESVNWTAARRSLRRAEMVTPPGRPLRLVYEILAWFDRHHSRARRQRLLAKLDERVRWELQSTDHTSLSPVSGFLNILALRSSYVDDPDAKYAIERLEAWIWENDQGGTRIAGARSASWDTALALQALTASAPYVDVEQSIQDGATFLESQQIRETFPGHEKAFRLDPKGGWCFASVWHGWPVSDCTAEALEALMGVPASGLDREKACDAVRFILRCQNADGGFGSYEARRSRVNLELLNPAEMFGDSMTEYSYVECTASCISALVGIRSRFPDLLGSEIDPAIARAKDRLQLLQCPDGSWKGVWGVQYIYGTLFGVRGLIAAGTLTSDSALRRACHWLRARQRPDGGWGEDAAGCVSGVSTEHHKSQVIQTAWALMALLEARDSDWGAIVRGARFLMDKQEEAGSWPRQDPAGVFFRTALLDYTLYRQYFPLWALSLYEKRRRERPDFTTNQSEPSAPAPDTSNS